MDQLKSYFAMRSFDVGMDENNALRFMLNDKLTHIAKQAFGEPVEDKRGVSIELFDA